MIEKLLLLLAVLCSGSSAFAATYVYQGANYDTASGSAYTTAMKVTGSFTTTAALPPNLSGQDIGPKGTNLVTGWSFNDGVNTYSTTSSSIYLFVVVTNGAGAITQFEIGLVTPRAPHTVNELLDQLALSTAESQATTGIPCTGVDNAGFCNNGAPVAGTSQAATTQPSAFTLSGSQGTVGAPVGSPLVLSMLALLLTLTAAWLLRAEMRLPS